MMPNIEANISRYFIYTILKGFGFAPFIAVWIINLQQRGYSLTEATIIDVAFFVTTAVFEVPTGLVADTFGRKTSLLIGLTIMGLSILGWIYAPTLLFVMVAQASMGFGYTFLSGADEALFYESLQAVNRQDDYPRLTGRVGATMLAATAFGSVTSGVLGEFDLRLPFFLASLSILLALAVVLTIKEPLPLRQAKEAETPKKSYGAGLKLALKTLQVRPRLRGAVLYLSIVPFAGVVLETFFLQPQTVTLGVPVVGLGVVVMFIQLTNVVGATLSQWITRHLGEIRLVYGAPVVIIASLVLLAAFQQLLALGFIALISFLTSILQPQLLGRIQREVSDEIRATMLSLQSLLFTLLLATGEPLLGLVADKLGLAATYLAMAGALSILIALLFSLAQLKPDEVESIEQQTDIESVK